MRWFAKWLTIVIWLIGFFSMVDFELNWRESVFFNFPPLLKAVAVTCSIVGALACAVHCFFGER